MKKEDRKKRFSLKSQSCLPLQTEVLFLPLSKVRFLLIQHFIAFLSSQDLHGGLVQCSGIFLLNYFQRLRSFHLCPQFPSVCFFWFCYLMLFKDCWILEAIFQLSLMVLNTHTHSFKEKWNVVWRSWWITKHIVGYFGHLSFSVRNFSFHVFSRGT